MSFGPAIYTSSNHGAILKGFELLFWFSNEVKQLAEGVRDKLRDLIYWRGEIRPKSPEEPQGEAGEQKAVREDYCSRRPRTGAAWEHKRQKVMAMKIGRWMR
jgi:U3 small nucleolar RNA-associated protein 20